MNVLILSCNTGGGHNAAARAVVEALRNKGHSCKMVDYLALASDFVSKEVCGSYISIVNHAPDLFNLIYKTGAVLSSPKRRSPVYYINKSFVRFLRKEFAAAHYDAVVATHIFAAQALTALRAKGELAIPFVCIATDYTCSPFWEEIECDRLVTPHPGLTDEFLQHGVEAGRIAPLGIPVSGACNLALTPGEAKAELGLPAQQPMVLLLGGSMGHGSQRELIDALFARKPFAPHVVVICGNNEKEQARLQKRYGKNADVTVLGFEKRVPLFMRAADVLFTKPGGLTSTEAAVVGAPIIFCNAIPGCETYNQLFFHRHGMAYAPDSVWAQSKAARLLAQNPDVAAAMVAAQRANIPQNSAARVCDLLEKLTALYLPNEAVCDTIE